MVETATTETTEEPTDDPIVTRKRRQSGHLAYGNGTRCPHVPNYSGFVCPATGIVKYTIVHETPLRRALCLK